MSNKLLDELVEAAMSEAYPEGDEPDYPNKDNFHEVNKIGFRNVFKKVLIRNRIAIKEK